jgi:hypothetical protein
MKSIQIMFSSLLCVTQQLVLLMLLLTSDESVCHAEYFYFNIFRLCKFVPCTCPAADTLTIKNGTGQIQFEDLLTDLKGLQYTQV